MERGPARPPSQVGVGGLSDNTHLARSGSNYALFGIKVAFLIEEAEGFLLVAFGAAPVWCLRPVV